MCLRRLVLQSLLLCFLSVVFSCPVYSFDYLGKLSTSHPRIIADSSREASIKAMASEDAFLQSLIADQIASADSLLTDPGTVEYKIVGPRLLSQSRLCLKRVLTLAGAYRLTDSAEKRLAYKQRAMKELNSAAGFKDWNPSHFLDTAEMTAAFAIGYDWLFDSLTEDEKALLVEAIYTKGLVPGMAGNHWWSRSAYNWNQVCNGGLTMGALAILDVLPEDRRETAIATIDRAVKTVPLAMKSFAPDGMWSEGPGYWVYTVLYTTMLIDTLETSLGTDFGLAAIEGFDKCCDAQLALSGATGQAYNFADAGNSFISCSMHFWMANKFNKPLYAEFERLAVVEKTGDFAKLKKDQPRPTNKLYPLYVWSYCPMRADLTKSTRDYYFRGAEIATLRSDWTKNAWYVGFKAGSNAVNHSHLELGSFILERNGVRWAVDLGADNYNLPGYFGNLRWTYYRLGTAGQNTILIDGKNQGPQAFVPITDFQSGTDRTTVTAKLTPAYAGQIESLTRTITLDRKESFVEITDQLGSLTSKGSETIVWQVHTLASIELDSAGRTAVLSQDGQKIKVVLTEPTNPEIRFQILPTTQGADENPNKGVQRLAIVLPAQAQPQTITVRWCD